MAHDAGSIALAREFIRVFLTRSGYTGSHDDVVLVSSEMVTNALRHGRGEVLLTASGDARRVRIEVADQGHRRPRHRQGGTDGGWGLLLLTALSAAWGVDDRRSGKVVWSELHAAEETASQPR